MNTTDFKTLASLLDDAGLLVSATSGADATVIRGAACDSRDVAAGNIFCCKGAAFAPGYLTKALSLGAVAYLCDQGMAETLAPLAPAVPVLVSNDVRRAMSVVSAEAWGHPDQHMEVLGITGTKGKSTVAYMLRSIIDAGEPYSKAAIMGSIETYDGIESFESHNTTPEAPELWRHLAHAREKGLTMVMEVSSQALKHERVDGLTYDVGCFLNIGRDHISPVEHPTFADYLESKLLIFSRSRHGVVNLDTDEAEEVLAAARTCPDLTTFSTTQDTADVWSSDVRLLHGAVEFCAHTPTWTGNVLVGMPGLFNVDNALAAIAMAQLVGIGEDQICDGLAVCRVPGRMELVESATGDIDAIIDYAHNGLSYTKLFESIQAEYPGRMIIAVFGAPGGKAQERRRELPETAAKYCDYVIYTEEDPGPERVEDICAQLSSNTPATLRHETICDRGEAIRRSVEIADKSDRECVLCLLAKGDETRQHRGDVYVPVPTDGDYVGHALRERDVRRGHSDGDAKNG